MALAAFIFSGFALIISVYTFWCMLDDSETAERRYDMLWRLNWLRRDHTEEVRFSLQKQIDALTEVMNGNSKGKARHNRARQGR